MSLICVRRPEGPAGTLASGRARSSVRPPVCKPFHADTGAWQVLLPPELRVGLGRGEGDTFFHARQ